MVDGGMLWGRVALPVILLSLVAGQAAQARVMPEPPPSGIVVHLFGPGSVTSNILPTAPGSVAPAASGETVALPASAPPTSAAPAYMEPGAGEILRQMFVTGDSDEPASAKLPKGRPGEQN